MKVNEQITVLLVEDHHVTMEGLRSWMEGNSNFKVVGTASTAGAAIEIARQAKPDVTLLDIHLPDNLKIDHVIAEITKAGSRVVIFSAEGRKYFVDLALKSGASSYLSKSEDYGTISRVLRDVHADNARYISDSLSIKHSGQPLTDTEKEVLVMLAKGKRYDDIAAARFTSAHTVRKQCDRLQVKLKLQSREELIAWAVTNGYAEASGD